MKAFWFICTIFLLFITSIKARGIIDSESDSDDEIINPFIGNNNQEEYDILSSGIKEVEEIESVIETEKPIDIDDSVTIDNEVDSAVEIETEVADTLEEATKFYNNYQNVEKDIVFNGERTLDVYYNPKDTKHKKPVNIYIFGGSWVSNDKVIFTRLGALLEEEDYIGVIPNYVLYPNGLMEDMIDDVYKAVQWTYDNIEKYGGDKEKIILTGHSSGAHLVAMTIIKAGLGLKNNGVELKPLPNLHRVVLMNGPYIFDQDFIVYTLQGTTDTSNASSTDDPQEQALLQELIQIYFNNDEVSPIATLRNVEKDSIKNHFNVDKFTFVYCSNDIVIPESSAKDLITEIIRTSPSQFEYIYLEGLEHASIINGIKTAKTEFENEYLDIIKK